MTISRTPEKDKTSDKPDLKSIIGTKSKGTTPPTGSSKDKKQTATTSVTNNTKPTSTSSTSKNTRESRHTNSACGNHVNLTSDTTKYSPSKKTNSGTTTNPNKSTKPTSTSSTPKKKPESSHTDSDSGKHADSNSDIPNTKFTSSTRTNLAHFRVEQGNKKDESKNIQTPPKKTPKEEPPKSTVSNETSNNSSSTTEEVKLELPKTSSSDNLNKMVDDVEKQKIEQQKKQQDEEKIKSLELKNNKDDLITNFHTYEKVKSEIEALDKAFNESNDALIIFVADHLKRNHGVFSNARSAKTVKQNEEKITKGKAALKYAFTILVTVSEEKSTDYSNTLERIAKLRNVLIKDGFKKYNDKSRSEGFEKIYDFALLGQLDNRLGALQEIYQALAAAMKADDFNSFNQAKAKIEVSNKSLEMKL